MRGIIFLISIAITAIAVHIALFSNLSEEGLKIIVGLVGIPFFLIMGFKIGYKGIPRKKNKA